MIVVWYTLFFATSPLPKKISFLNFCIEVFEHLTWKDYLFNFFAIIFSKTKIYRNLNFSHLIECFKSIVSEQKLLLWWYIYIFACHSHCRGSPMRLSVSFMIRKTRPRRERLLCLRCVVLLGNHTLCVCTRSRISCFAPWQKGKLPPILWETTSMGGGHFVHLWTSMTQADWEVWGNLHQGLKKKKKS